jgi:accessory colonization factor AcfC
MLLRRLALRFAMLALLLVPAAAHAWPHSPGDNVLIASATYAPISCSDGAGGCFVAYYAYHDPANGYDIYGQHYDSAGNPMWASGGVVLCAAPDYQFMRVMTPDGAGGFIGVWEDSRTSATTGVDIYAQRFTANGAALWTANGLPVSVAAGGQQTPRVVVNQYGAWIVWQDGRNLATNSYDIYAQHIDMGGFVQGPANGAVVCNSVGNQQGADVAVDDFGRGIFTWCDWRSGTGDIYAVMLTNTGTTQWAANGVVVCNAASHQTDPFIQLIAGQRVVVAWSDSRSGDYDVYAQRLDNYTGAGGWTANGIPMAVAPGTQYLSDMTRDANGNVVMVWGDGRVNTYSQDLYVQRVDPLGVVSWGSSGLAVRIGPSYARNPKIVSDQVGGVIVAWSESRVDEGDIYMQRIHSSGYALWTSNGVPVCTAAGTQQNVTLCPGLPGGAIAAWDDNRTASVGARIQGVDEWGFLGAEPVMAGVRDVPNDQGGQVKVSWDASPLDTDILFRNISDYIVYRSAPVRLAAQLAAISTADGATLNGRHYVRTQSASGTYYWEELAHVLPRHLSGYSYLAATTGDSVAGSNPRTAFMVMAIGNYGNAWWVTKADSGYSVDNLPPAAPAPFLGQYAAGTTALHWNRNTEPDVAGYRLYRGATPGFAIGASSLVAQLPDTGYVDAAAGPYFYKLTAVDAHGNESPIAALQPAGTTDVAAGALRAGFAAPAPNPMRGGGTTLRFTLASAGVTRLAIYDAQGRVVRVLAEGVREAGAHSVAFDGRDHAGRALPAGLYLARFSAPGMDVTRRLVVVE